MNPPTPSPITDNFNPLRSAFKAVGFLSLLTALEFIFFKPYFLVNDDHFQLFILKGIGIGLFPDAHVFFTHVFLSFPLSVLYRWFPLLPWYPLSLLAIQFMSFAALAVSLTQNARSKALSYILFTVFFMVFGLYNFHNVNFTLTSCLAFQGGFFLLLEPAENPDHPNRKMYLGFGTFCLFLSFLCRPESFFLSAFITIPVTLITYQRSSRRDFFLRYILGLAVLLSFFLLFDHLYYSGTPGWKKYGDTAPALRELHDFHPLPYNQTTQAFFKEINWSPNDLLLFKNWYFWDEDRYSLENFKILKSHFSSIKPAAQVLQNFLDFGKSPTAQGLSVCLLFSFLFFRKSFVKSFLIYFFWIFGFLLYIALYLKLPERIFFPTLAFLVLLAFRQCIQGRDSALPSGDSPNSLRLRGWILVLFIPIFLYQVYWIDQYKRDRESALKNSVAALHPEDNQLFIVWDSQYPFESIGALDDFSQYRTFHMLSFAGYQQAPLTKLMMSHFHLVHPLRDLVNNPSVFLICNPYEGVLGLTYLREKFGIDAVAFKTFESTSFKVYQLKTRSIPSHAIDVQDLYHKIRHIQ